jgi:hypothetical protein
MDSNFFFNLLWPRTISICYDEDVGFGSTFFSSGACINVAVQIFN